MTITRPGGYEGTTKGENTMKKITGMLIDVANEKASVVTIDHELQSFYDILGCRLVEMPTRRIGVRKGRNFTIICDEEGLFVDYPKISAIDNMGQVMLVGNLFIVKPDGEGDILSLDEDDIKYLERFIQPESTRMFPNAYPMLHQCEYAK